MNRELINDFLLKCEENDGDLRYHNSFSTLSLNLDYIPAANRIGNEDLRSIQRAVSKQVRYIEKDIDLLDSLVHRLIFYRENHEEFDFDPRLLNRYITVDLESFHVVYRSLFDHIAIILFKICDQPGQFEITSFQSQREKILNNEGFRDRIGNNIFDLILYCDWFDEIRSIRNGLVHHGRWIEYMIRDDYFLINADQELERLDSIPRDIFQDGWLIAELYLGLVMVYLHSYLDQLEEKCFQRLNFPRHACNTGREHPIINNYYQWMSQLTE